MAENITKKDDGPVLENIDYDLLHDNFLMMLYIKRYQMQFKKRLEEWHVVYWDQKTMRARHKELLLDSNET